MSVTFNDLPGYLKEEAAKVYEHRTVLVKAEIELFLDVPKDWTPDLIEFHLNESSWCADNIISELQEQSDKRGCLCSAFSAKYVREANAEDEELLT